MQAMVGAPCGPPHPTCQVVEYPVQTVDAHIWHPAAGSVISLQCSPACRHAAALTLQCSAIQNVSRSLQSLSNAPCQSLSWAPRKPCRHATQQCSATQTATMLLPMLSSAAQPRTSACSCSPSAVQHTLPQHDNPAGTQPCRHAKQHAWLRPSLPEAVAAHVVSHDAALLGHPLVSSSGGQDCHCACTRRGCSEETRRLDCLGRGARQG